MHIECTFLLTKKLHLRKLTMIKYFITISLFLILLSCTKKSNDASPCYDCDVQRSQSMETDRRVVCTNKMDTMWFADANGNQLQWTCTERK